jgi:hypothetical protein
MANNPTPLPHQHKGDKELALWMLERMQDSEEFLGVIQKARIAGTPDVLDTPGYVERHKQRLRKLYQSDTEGDVSTSVSTVAKLEMLMQRDMLSSPEEFVEKALAAYIERHGSDGLPKEWQSTFAAARDEVEGKSNGAFEPGFAAGLAASAREDLARQTQEQFKRRGHDGRDA